MASSVAFFRNLNLGQGWAPTRPQLVAAFEGAGAERVQSVQTNGTVIFDSRAPVRTVREVGGVLRRRTGYDDLAVVRSAAWLRALGARLAHQPVGELPVDVGLYDAPTGFELRTPWTTADGRTEVVTADRRHAVTVFRADGTRGSNTTAVLERLTGCKVTSRGAPTMLRVVARLPLG